MRERQQDGPEEEFVIRLPPNEIQRQIVLNRQSLRNLKGRAIALRDQPRNREGQARLESAQKLIQWQTGLLTAYEDAQTLEWEESPEEQQLRQERTQRLAKLVKEPWSSLTQEEQRFLAGYRWGRWEISLKPEK